MIVSHISSDGGTTVQQIQVTATVPRIPKDNLSEFKRLAGEALEITADEPYVLQYDWFFNADESKCVVREIYADSDAVLSHLGLVGDLLGKIIEVGGGIEIEVFGDPSDALLEATAALQPSVYAYFQGKLLASRLALTGPGRPGRIRLGFRTESDPDILTLPPC